MFGSVVTLPTDFCFRNERNTMNYLLRECHSNAKNYNASKSLAVPVRMQGNYYLFYLHNGTPFNNAENILREGLTPNYSALKGAAFQGSGLVYSAFAICRFPELIIASTTEEEGFVICKGFIGKRFLNQWDSGVFPGLANEFYEIIGSTWRKFNVAYGFKIPYTPQGSSILNPSVVSTSAMLAPSLLKDIDFRFCERVIDPREEDASSYEVYCRTLSTNAARKSLNNELYLAAHRWSEFALDSEKFDLNYSSDIKVYGHRCRIVVNFFPGLRKMTPSGSLGKWLVTLRRDPSPNPAFLKGQQTGYSRYPSIRSFLTVPWVYRHMKKNGKYLPHYDRFRDNCLGTYDRIQSLMGLMGLPYYDHIQPIWLEFPEICPGKSAYKPFVTINVELLEVDSIECGNVKSNDPHMLLQALRRRPDFTLDHRDAVCDIMKSACRNAIANVPSKLRELCNIFFPIEDDVVAPIKIRNEVEIDVNTGQSVIVFDVETGDEFKKSFHVGETSEVVLFHKLEKRYIRADELVKDYHTRGIKLIDLSEVPHHHYPGIKKIQSTIKERHFNS